MTDFYSIKEVDHVKRNVIEKVNTMLTKGRRYFGSSGANFTEQAFKTEWKEREKSQYKEAEKIVDAEREYTKILKEWIKDKPNAVLIDSLYVPGHPKLNIEDFELNDGLVTDSFTGHILLIGNEVFVIDSLPFNKKKRYSLDLDGKILETDKEFLYTKKSNMNDKFSQWINYYDQDALLTAIVGFTGEEAYTERYKPWFQSSYRLLEQNRYTEFLNQKYEVIDDKDKHSINPNLVAQTIIRCVKPFDKYQNIFNPTALAQFK